MARYDFGGTLADFVVTSRRLGGLDVLGLSAATLTFWSAQSGGTRYTDLQVNGSATSSILVGTDGQVPTFQGPDTITAMWADGGSARVRIVAQGIPGPAGPGATNSDIAAVVTATGATQTALDARYPKKGNLWLNVKDDFGAAGDGSTDDTAAIVAAIAGTPTGGHLHFPKGNYVTAPVVANKHIRITGEANGRTLLTPKAGSTGSLLTVDPGSFVNGMYVQGLHIVLTNFPAMTGITVGHWGSGSILEQCRVSSGDVGLSIANTAGTIFRDLTFADPITNGILDNGDGGQEHTFDNIIINRSAAGTTAAAFELVRTTVDDTGGLYFSKCVVSRGGGTITYGYKFASSYATDTPIFMFMNQCVADNINGTAAMFMQKVTQVQISDSFYTTSDGTTKNSINLDAARHVLIDNTWLVGGISYLNQPQHIKISGSCCSVGVFHQMPATGQPQPLYLMLTGNRFLATATLTNDQALLTAATSNAPQGITNPNILIPSNTFFTVQSGAGGSADGAFVDFNSRARFGYSNTNAVIVSDNSQGKPISLLSGGSERLRVDNNGNVGVGMTAFDGKTGIFGIRNCSAAPAGSNPAAGGWIYVEGGALKYKGSSGTVTVLGPA